MSESVRLAGLDELAVMSEDVGKVECLNLFIRKFSRVDIASIQVDLFPILNLLLDRSRQNILPLICPHRILHNSHRILATTSNQVTPLSNITRTLPFLPASKMMFPGTIDHQQSMRRMLLIIKRTT